MPRQGWCRTVVRMLDRWRGDPCVVVCARGFTPGPRARREDPRITHPRARVTISRHNDAAASAAAPQVEVQPASAGFPCQPGGLPAGTYHGTATLAPPFPGLGV